MEKIGLGRKIIEESLSLSLLGFGMILSLLCTIRAEGLGMAEFEEKDEGKVDVALDGVDLLSVAESVGTETGVFAVGV